MGAYEQQTYNYKDPVTTQLMDQMQANMSYVAEHRIKGCNVTTVSTSTCTFQGGVMELAGKWLTRSATTVTSLVLSVAGDWITGTDAEAADTGIYVMAYNDSSSSWNIKYDLTPPDSSDCSGHTNGPLMYRNQGGVWYRAIGMVRNNGSSDLIPIAQDGNHIDIQETTSLTTNVQTGSFGDSYDLTGRVPIFAKKIKMGVASNRSANGEHWIQLKDTNGTATRANTNGLWSGDSNKIGGELELITTGRSVDHRQEASCNGFDMTLKGYSMNIGF